MFLSRLLYLIFLISSFFLYLFHEAWFAQFLFRILLFLPLLSLCLSWLILRSKITTKLQPYAIVDGLRIPFEVYVDTPFSFVPPIHLRYSIYDALSQKKKKYNAMIQEEKNVLPLDIRYAGSYQVEIEEAKYHDFLGLFTLYAHIAEGKSILVYPMDKEVTPLPNIQELFQNRIRKKVGGGFSEMNELRSYQMGDPLSSLHYKASAKRDEWIVKESQESEEKRIVLSFSYHENRLLLDDIWGQLFWLSSYLIVRQISHTIVFRNPEYIYTYISSQEDLDKFKLQLLHSPIPKAKEDVEDNIIHADIHYRIKESQ